MKTLIWLDDIRNPFVYDGWLIQYAPDYAYGDGRVIWVKSYLEFTDWITQNGLPDKIAFDHDLGIGKTGKDCANWLVGYCMDNDKFIPDYVIQSANPVGKENIDGLLSRFEKFTLKR